LPAITAPPGTAATVVRVFDGDSLIVSIDGKELEVRLLGINAPEGNECHGNESRDMLEQLLSSGALTLVADTEDTDQYGRLLRYLYVDGLNVNLAMLANGDAVVLQGEYSADANFAAISDAAAARGIGMWALDACGEGTPPTGITIADYVYNPAGSDGNVMNDEWVAIANRGEGSVDLSGWLVRDESTEHRFHFPDGFRLAADDAVVVHSGCDSDSRSDLYWCSDGPVWSNGGDTVIVQLPGGTVVARERYSGDF
jgi:endonuclease YncB( thermonuclease family)